MTHIKSSINVKYIVESYDGAKWVEQYNHTILDQAIKELEYLKKTLPQKKFRLIRSEWSIIEYYEDYC